MNFDQDRVCLIGCFYLILAEQVESFLFDQAIDTGLVPGRLFDQDKIFSQVVFPGGLLMALLKKAGGFSVIGISIAGGVCHNIGQLVVAMIVVETFAMSYYMPVLLVAGLITGFLIGVVADQVLRRISDIMFLE